MLSEAEPQQDWLRKKNRSSSKRRNFGDSQPKTAGKKQKKREKKNNQGKADKQGDQSENPDSSPSVASPIQQANNRTTSNIFETLAGAQEDTYL